MNQIHETKCVYLCTIKPRHAFVPMTHSPHVPLLEAERESTKGFDCMRSMCVCVCVCVCVSVSVSVSVLRLVTGNAYRTTFVEAIDPLRYASVSVKRDLTCSNSVIRDLHLGDRGLLS